MDTDVDVDVDMDMTRDMDEHLSIWGYGYGFGFAVSIIFFAERTETACVWFMLPNILDFLKMVTFTFASFHFGSNIIVKNIFKFDSINPIRQRRPFDMSRARILQVIRFGIVYLSIAY